MGDSRDGADEMGTDLPLRRSSHHLHLQDGSQPRSDVLEVPTSPWPAMQLLPVDGEPVGSSSGHPSPELGVHQEAGTGGMSTSHHDSIGFQCIHRDGFLQGLRQGTQQGEEEEAGARRSTDTEEATCTSFGDFSGELNSSRGRRVPGVSTLEGASGPEPSNVQPARVEEAKSRGAVHVKDLRPGLRRHIYGCLKRSEACWLDIHNLLCHTSEVDQDKHLETTCKVIRQSLQLQQPALKHFAELYLLQPKHLKTVAEVCNPARFARSADVFGLKAGQSFDLELGWDLLDPIRQQAVKDYIATEQPGLTVISPPCTLFSMLQNLNWPRWTSDTNTFEKHMVELRKAKRLLKFCAEICQLCIDLQLSFLFEHPWSASSWQEPCLSRLVNQPSCHLARGDQCMFQLVDQSGELMRKRSGFLTNNIEIAKTLNLTCDRSHEHQHVMGKAQGASINRSRLAQKYPPALINAVLGAYAVSVGLAGSRIYVLDANEVIQNEAVFESHFVKELKNLPQPHELHVAEADNEEEIEIGSDPEPVAGNGPDQEPDPEDRPRQRSFPGTHPLSLEALVKRAHEGLGHPGKERFLRILTSSKASPKVLEIARNLRCSICEKFKLPKPSRAGAPPKEIGLNEIVGIDSIQLRTPFSKKTKYCLNIIDYHSHFQLIVPLRDHTALEARLGYRLWLKIFGPPRKLLCDLGKEFQKQFENAVEADGTELIPSYLETPEQRGFVERNGQLFKEMFYKTIDQTCCNTWEDWWQTIDLVCSMKNRLLSRGGYSPAQRVFGYQQRIPGGLMSEGEGDFAVQSLQQSGDPQVSKSMEIRKLAAQAFHEVDCQQAIRAAATHGPRPHYAYETGQAVYFWRRGTDPARRSASAFWHGPARVVATQLPTTVWLSYNHHLVKAAPEKLRPASEEEFFTLSGWLEGISHAKRQFETEDIKGMIDLSTENDEIPSEYGEDYWRRNEPFWIRVHVQPRERLFHPEAEQLHPALDSERLKPWRKNVMKLQDGTTQTFEDNWNFPADVPSHRQSWTGETWFEILPEEENPAPKREAKTIEPTVRLSKKTRFTTTSSPGVGVAEEEPTPTPDGEQPLQPPPGLPAPETSGPSLPSEELASETNQPSVDLEFDEEDRKRDHEQVEASSDVGIEAPAKRSRLEFLEIYYNEVLQQFLPKQKKNKEATVKDFQGRDYERLQRAIHKEYNNNLATGAYRLLSPQESTKVRNGKADKLMKSRYVLTKKPIEDFAVEDAIAADELLDSSEKGCPSKAKCRHVMQGYSEAGILELETTTPQVHRDSVIYAAQLMASMHWEPGFADFTQAFHSGDPINRELYAEQPREGLPGAQKGQVLQLLKTCYGLTDGPYAWYQHIVKYLREELHYRQSVVDPCLFYLDTVPDEQGNIKVEGVIALATDDLFHGGSHRHVQQMEKLRSRYKLGKYTWRSGRFVGKDISLQEDGSMLISQQFYVEAKVQPIPLTRGRKRRKYSVCTPMEIEQLRTLVGVLAWVAKETRCDLAGKTAILQQSFPKPQVKDLIVGNQLAKEALDFKHLGIKVMPIPLERLHAGVVTDASWGNAKEFGTYLESTDSPDYWEEQSDRWIRRHLQPRLTAFHPAAAPSGPDLHDLLPERDQELMTGEQITSLTDQWTTSDSLRTLSTTPWTGSTTFYKQDKGNVLDAKDIHAGYEQLNKLFSQGGEIVIFYDQDLPTSQAPQNVTIGAWKSYRLKRRTVNTLSSETQSLVRGLGAVHWFRVLILESKGMHLSARDWQRSVAQLPFICVVDSKSLYDTVQKCVNPASQCEDKRTSIDIALIKEELSQLGGTIRWVDGRTMLADSLTKEMRSDLLRHVIESGRWSILEEGASLQQKLLERKPSYEVMFVL